MKKSVTEIESSQIGKSVLLHSIEWLEATKNSAENETEKLVKQMFLCDLKLHKNSLTEKVTII